jgi:hypothetical protein
MKFSHLILLSLFCAGISMISCKDSAEESKTDTPEVVSPNSNGDMGVMSPTNQTVPAIQQDPNTAAGATGGQQHYKCQTAGCAGGGAAAGSCPVCGAELVHNQAFHSQNQATPATPSTTPVMIDPATGQPATPEQMSPPSAQNSAGEYHYACPSGHAGAASAGKCSTCGAELTHNAAYHNK